MPTVTVEENTYRVNDEGFLQDASTWTDEVAMDFAALEGIPELSDDHWTVIHFVRGYYLQHGVPPMMGACRAAPVSD